MKSPAETDKPQIACKKCEEFFTPKNNKAQFCKPKCRVAYARARDAKYGTGRVASPETLYRTASAQAASARVEAVRAAERANLREAIAAKLKEELTPDTFTN